jgi:hypothetical protein
VRAALLALVCACGGGSTSAASTTPTAHDPSACPDAYAAYERDWRTALTEDLNASGTMETTDVDAIVARQIGTLPRRHELDELRAINKLIEIFLWDAAWPAAFTSADHAIEICGEGTPKPH